MSQSILVVDDEPEVIEVLESKLKIAGFDVRCAGKASEAIAAFIQSLDKKPFDVILLDIRLPDMDGREILETIRNEEDVRGIDYGYGVVVIMQTGFKEPWLDSFRKGCDDYILKPYSSEALILKVKERLKIKEARG